MRARSDLLLLVLLGCSGGSSDGQPSDSGPDAADAAGDTAGDAVDAAGPDALVESLAGKRVLFIGAHPDDESAVAPLLGEACVERGARCSFFVATRGDAGKCKLATGCPPDLATFRVAEMKAAAALYGGTAIQWDLPDGSAASPEEVAKAWAALRGGTDALVEAFRAEIAKAAPEVVITFDPRHGTSCHPDHRATSALAVLAIRKLAVPPRTWLAEVRFDIDTAKATIGYVPAVAADPAMRTYDATRWLGGFGATGWGFLLENLRKHPSQFDAPELAAFSAAPAAERRVFLLDLADVVDADARYGLCK